MDTKKRTKALSSHYEDIITKGLKKKLLRIFENVFKEKTKKGAIDTRCMMNGYRGMEG